MWSVWIRRLSFFRSPFSAWILAAAGILLGGCATPFPVATTNYRHPDGRDGAAVLATTLVAHGGDLRARGGDIAAAVTGEWSALITRIQPLVTDHRWRIDAQERLLPAEGLHAIRWSGPAGEKLVVRTPSAVRVFYNGMESSDDDVLASSAMTSDAFQLFLCGPSFIAWREHPAHEERNCVPVPPRFTMSPLPWNSATTPTSYFPLAPPSAARRSRPPSSTLVFEFSTITSATPWAATSLIVWPRSLSALSVSAEKP